VGRAQWLTISISVLTARTAALAARTGLLLHDRRRRCHRRNRRRCRRNRRRRLHRLQRSRPDRLSLAGLSRHGT
jgi:hypothetical protein